MATYTLNLVDGSQVTVDAPPNITRQELFRLANEQMQGESSLVQKRREALARQEEQRLADQADLERRLSAPVEPEETGIFGDLRKGFGAGFVETGETAALGAATLLDEGAEVSARDRIQSIADAIKPEGGDKDDLSYKIGQTFGSIAGFAAPAAAAAYLAPAGLTAAAGEASERARAAGATEEERTRAVRTAAPFGLLEVAPLGRFMRAVDVPVVNKLIDKLGPETVESIGQRIQNAAVTGGAEGAQEATSEIVQNLIERGYNPERDILEGSGESAALGGGAGATIQFLVDAFTNSRKSRPTTPEVTEEGPAQGELDLRGGEGEAPRPGLRTNFLGEQAEMFPGAELGTAPRREEPTRDDQPDLFSMLAEEQDTQREPDLVDRMEQQLLPSPDTPAVVSVDSRGRAVTSTERAAQREPDMKVLERAREEIRALGDISPDTLQRIARTNIPMETVSRVLGTTRFEPALAKQKQGPEVPEGFTPPKIETLKEPLRLPAPPKLLERPKTLAEQAIVADEPAAPRTPLDEQRARQQLANQRRAQTRQDKKLAEAAESTDPVMERGRVLGQTRPMTRKEQQDAARRLETEGTGRGVPSGAEGVGQRGGRGLRADQSAEEPAAPVEGRLGRRMPDVRVPPVAARKRDGTLDFATAAKVQQWLKGTDDAFTGAPITLSDLKEGDEVKLAREYKKRATAAYDQKYGIGPTEQGLPHRRTPSAQWNGMDFQEARKEAEASGDPEMLQAYKEIERTSIELSAAEDIGSRPAEDARRNLKEMFPEYADQIDADVYDFVKRAVDIKVDRIEPTFTPEQGKARAKPKQKASVETLDDGSTGRAGQVIPGVARSKTTGKKLAAHQTRFQPKPTYSYKQQPKNEKTQKQKAKKAFEDIHKQRPESVRKESAEAVRTSSPVPDYIDTKDQKRIYAEIKQPRTGKTGVRNALYKYFSQYRRPEDAIEAILNDSLYFDAERKASDFAHNPRQAEFYGANPDENLPSTGKTAATKALNWLRQNLRPETVQQINDRIDIPMRDAFVDLYSQEESTFTKGVAADLKAGKLEDALKTLSATLPNRNLRRIATKLLQNVGDAKVKVVKNLKAKDGRLLHGEYDPQTNTITLDATRGMTPHTLLHEMLHATTSAALAKKSHPLRRQLRDIYERAKAELGEVDGMESIDEFYAEALSNPAFQSMLRNVSGKEVQLWKRFTTAVRNTVRNIMGMSTQRADVRTGIQTEIDNLVEDLISPTIPSRDASKLYMAVKDPASSKEYINDLGPTMQKVDKNYYDRARDFIANALIPRSAKKLYLDAQPLNIVSELAKEDIPAAKELNDLVNGMSAELRQMNNKLIPLVNKLREFKKRQPEKYATLLYLVPNASHQRVDPRADTYKKAYSGSADKQDVYKELKKQYNSLGAEGQDLYRSVTRMFETSLDNVVDSIEANLKATVEDAATRKRAFDELAKQLNLTRGKIRPFAPLTRDGDYVLEYNTLDPTTGEIQRFVERFTSYRSREKAVKALADYNAKLAKEGSENYTANKAVINKEPIRRLSSSVGNYKDAPSNSFVYNVLQTLNEAGIKDDRVIDQIVNLALDSMPERSFMQQFRTRKDTRGFLGDVTPTGMAGQSFDLIKTVRNKGRDYNRQIVQMKYGAAIQNWKQEVNKDTENADQNTTIMKDTLFEIANFAQRPNVNVWSQRATGFGYLWTMGVNLSSAAITFLDVPMSALPRLSAKYGDLTAVNGISEAIALLHNAPREFEIDTYGPNGEVKSKVNAGYGGASISHYTEMPKGLSSLRYLIEVAGDRAQFGQSLNQEQLDLGQRTDLFEIVTNASSFLFHHAERYNREVIMVANYLLDLRKAEADGVTVDADYMRQAALRAVDEVEFVLGSTASAGRPVMAQSAIGNVVFLFKRFAMSKYYMMARMFDEAFSSKLKGEERRVARHALARFLGLTGVISGVAGMPMMGAMGMIYDLFAADEEDDFESAARKVLGEGLWKGLVNDALGVDVASRVSMNSMLYRPPFIEKDQSSLWTLAEQLGGPVVGIYNSMDRGAKLWSEGEWWRGTEAVMPAAVRSGLKSYRYATAGAETRRGDPIMSDISPWNLASQAIGFAPADYIRTLEYNQNEKRKDEALMGKRRRLLRKYNLAAVEGDIKGMLDVQTEINKYNANLPISALGRKLITPDSLKRSRRAFDDTTARMRGGVEYTPFMLDSLAEYDRGLQLFN